MQEKDKKSNYPDNTLCGAWCKGFIGEDKYTTKQISLKISVIYIFIGILWILLSDKILGLLVKDKTIFRNISMIKGWIYVLATGILIYLMVYCSLKRIKATEGKLIESCKSLTEANMELAAAYEQVAGSQNQLKFQYEKLVEYESELHHQAYYDQLTAAQNRLALIKNMNKLMLSQNDIKLALIIVDIDNFKLINDTMGHSFGDDLLIKVSKRLEYSKEENCTIYRLSGDEFVILIENFDEITTVEKLAVKFLNSFKTRFEVNNRSTFITISMGVSLYPEHGDSLDELLKSSDIALYKAKEAGRNRVVFFNKTMNEAVIQRAIIEKHLRTALDNNEFELYYQPQIDVELMRITGLEALIRWNSPELGFVSPLKFISIAEDTHLIVPIGEWVLKNACAFLKRLHQNGYEDLSISVNISMLQLLQDDFGNKVMEILDWTKLDSRYLELEITESILMESYEAIEGKLKTLKNRGIRIALDDFGKGYSSLNYLKLLPISTLKIDKSFIDTIESVENDKSITDLIVRIGRIMGLCVVAEGVENREQLDYLIKHQCCKIQGYLFSKPIQEKEVIGILNKATWDLEYK